MEEKTLVDRLLDAEDVDTLELFTEEDEPMEFEQIAVLMYEDIPYTILRPLSGKENEVLVFEFFEELEEAISVVEDKKLAQAVLNEYKRIVKELQVK